MIVKSHHSPQLHSLDVWLLQRVGRALPEPKTANPRIDPVYKDAKKSSPKIQLPDKLRPRQRGSPCLKPATPSRTAWAPDFQLSYDAATKTSLGETPRPDQDPRARTQLRGEIGQHPRELRVQR
ncbi:hypothetical protein PSPO01_01592 [Paraphaeosphaeria sporulosa]